MPSQSCATRRAVNARHWNPADLGIHRQTSEADFSVQRWDGDHVTKGEGPWTASRTDRIG